MGDGGITWKGGVDAIFNNAPPSSASDAALNSTGSKILIEVKDVGHLTIAGVGSGAQMEELISQVSGALPSSIRPILSDPPVGMGALQSPKCRPGATPSPSSMAFLECLALPRACLPGPKGSRLQTSFRPSPRRPRMTLRSRPYSPKSPIRPARRI